MKKVQEKLKCMNKIKNDAKGGVGSMCVCAGSKQKVKWANSK